MSEKICFNNNSFLIFIIILIFIISAKSIGEYLISQKVNNLPKVIHKPKVNNLPKVNPSHYVRVSDSNSYPTKYNNGNSIGYIFDEKGILPLYEERNNRDYYYFTIDDSRNGIKIPLPHKKQEILYDGEPITSPEMNRTFTVKRHSDFN